MKKVLDAWAVLAWAQNERPAADAVRGLLKAQSRGSVELLMNLVNLGEVYYTTWRTRGRDQAARMIDLLSRVVRTVAADREIVLEAAGYKARYPISYADGFAMATAISENAALVTGGPDFRSIDLRELGGALRIEWLSRATSGGPVTRHNP